ncbi:phage tail tape measure C-terminal domain-containing protein [Roseovarius indicus]|uniref:phage tail tape measure C-terminal domain-containing protein n=1 Tax=Roseovarius indicus TaxID=540747 RepID=UPI0007D9E063|nr:phage tail tape measure C-terminal domain-containing protein [Roseovarius indicus]OAO05914.1 hypothetical protein A8B76_11975 [Roseovarius indicus]
MAETHELRLSIDASAAKRGSREFIAATNAVKQAVTGLEKDTDGLFTKIKKTTSAPAGKNSQAAAFTSMRTAARAAESQVATLHRQLNKTGNASGIKRADNALEHFRQEMAASVRTTEDLRIAKDRLAQTLHEVREEARGAAEVQRLRTQYQRTAAALDPLTTGTHAYRRAVLATEQAHRAGAISTHQMNQTLARAKEAYIGAGSAAENYAAQQARLYGTRAGWGLGPGAGRQLGLQLNQIGQVVGMATSAEQALKSMSYQAADVGLVFGPVGMAVGTFAGVALPLLIDRLYEVIPPAKTFKDALDELNSSIEQVRSTSNTDFSALAAEYGKVTEQVYELVRVQRILARIDATKALNETRTALFDQSTQVGMLDSLRGYANNAAGQLRMIRNEFDLTAQQATTLRDRFNELAQAEGPDEMAAAWSRIKAFLGQISNDYTDLSDAQLELLRNVVKGESATRMLKAAMDGTAGAANSSTAAASNLSAELGTAANAAAQLLANLGSVPAALSALQGSVQDQIAGIQATNRSLEIQLSEGLTSAAANRKVQLEDMVKAAQSGDGRVSLDQIATAAKEIETLEQAAKRTKELRDQIAEANRPSKGSSGAGSRKGALSEEAKAVDDLNKSLQDRLTGLQAERIELELLASGQFKTAEGAAAMAEAMTTGTGVVDAQTAAMIRQIDAAAKLNEELRKVAEDPVKKWMDSVPNWIEAGQQIEMGAINHVRDAISEMMKTGKFDIEALGDAILGTIADIVADKAVKELHTLLGGDDRSNGGLLGGLFGSFESVGDPATAQTGQAVAQGGMQAGQSISTAMVQAGQTVSQQLAQAMTQGGQMTGQQVQQAHAMGGQQAANATRLAGVLHGQQVRLATNTSGNQHATRVKTAIETGGREHASMVRSATSGSTGSGSILDMFGGTSGILSMAIGAFSEGGYSTAPANFSTAPISAFRHAPHFAEGTPNTSGIPAILHDNEAVVPLSKGRKLPVEMQGGENAGGGATVQNFNWNVQTPDVEGFRRSQSQLAADAGRAGARAMKKND